MSRFRRYPTPQQEAALLEHCAHARFVWNLAWEQRSWWQPGRPAPGFAAQCHQLTDARAAFPWLEGGSIVVQQQALRDSHQAWANWFKAFAARPPSPPGLPGWRKREVDEGFRIVAVRPKHVRRLNRRWGEVAVPKVGPVRFRWTREVPAARSYRIVRDRAGRWHVAFAAIPGPIPGPWDGSVVGIDRGVAVSFALSDGRTFQAPADRSVKRLQRRLSRARCGSNRRAKVKRRLARAGARNADRRRDWVEQTSTEVARSYDLIRIEGLNIVTMTRWLEARLPSPAGTSGRNVRQERPAEGRAQPGHPSLRLGRVRHPPGGQGVRAHRSGEPQEPSPPPLRGLLLDRQRRCERGQEHRGRACRDCAGRHGTAHAGEPRTSARGLLCCVAGIPGLPGRRGCQRHSRSLGSAASSRPYSSGQPRRSHVTRPCSRLLASTSSPTRRLRSSAPSRRSLS
jgi:putative transposase